MQSRIIKETFHMIAQPAITVTNQPDIPEVSLGCGCDNVLKVLADDSGQDLRNDRSGFLWWFNDLITTAVLKIEKYENGAWVVKTTLTANTTLGTAYDFAFFTNQVGENFVGYQLNWSSVLSNYGEGSYRIKCEVTDFSATTTNLYSDEYCLKTYTPERANGTVRLEYYLNGTLGINNDDKKVRDLGTLNWYNSFRLGGYFGFNTSSYEEERIKYNTGELMYTKDEQTPEFTLKLKPQAYFVHEYMRTDVMQADDIYITDYNSRNAINLITKNVYKNSGYEPTWKPLVSKLAGVEVKFKQKFNNHKKLRY